jgi:hypothetical protein
MQEKDTEWKKQSEKYKFNATQIDALRAVAGL